MLLKRMSVGLVLTMAAALILSIAGPAGAVTFPNGCRNSVTADWTGLNVTLTGTAPATVAPGAQFQVTGISQELALPGALFVAGYNLGLLQVGPNSVPGTIVTTIQGTNTVEGTQNTNTANITANFTISDPDGTPGTGDETGTDATVSNSYSDMTWTAGASGIIEFSEDFVAPTSTTGGIRITAVIGGFLQVKFGCSPGTVDEVNNIFTPQDPGATFASSTIESAPVNNPPTANAGTDQTVASGASVNLNGTGSSDPDGDTLTYAWSQVSGPAVTLSGANTATASFTAPTGPATLEFQLQVCDQEPLCDTDNVVVNVNAPPPVNSPPTANAGPDQTVASGASVTLNGTGSSDPDADILTYAWTQLSGPAVTLTGANTVMASFTAPTGPATLEFELEVCDPEPLCDTDTVVVTVSEEPPVNSPPTANAGPDQTVASGASVTLNGAGSSDPDGDILAFAWTQLSGPSVTLSGANTVMASFLAPTGPATLEFQLEVCDQEPLCDTDTVVVTVNAEPPPGGGDLAMDAIIHGPIREAAGHKGTVAKVCNVGSESITFSDADITSEVTFNGSVIGDGTFVHKNTGTFTLNPGACKRFRIDYVYGTNGPVHGDSVVFTHTVSAADDANTANNSDSTEAQLTR